MDKIKLLKTTFGFNSFRDKQEETIDSLLNKKNTLCLMPTGMGKSLIYQFTTIANNKMTLIFSPLLALMAQQSNQLNRQLTPLNKSAFAFNSNFKPIQQYKYLKDNFNPPNEPAFLFLSPEKIMTDGYLEFVLKKYKTKIGLIVIDEAHCVSQWGNNFRPAYKLLPKMFNNIFGDDVPTTLCLTATINQKDKEEIIKEFNIDHTIVSDSLYRHNIELIIKPQVKKNINKKEELETILHQYKNEKVIVYTHIKKRDYGTRAMSEYFKKQGFNCAPFDSDLDKKEKILNNFINGKINIIFATNAFGMGIDIPDIRLVVHYQIPESLEQYYQEVGRAGRDGKKARAILLHSEPNARIKKDLIKKEKISAEEIKEIWESFLGKKKEKQIPHIGTLNAFEEKRNRKLEIFLSLVRIGNISIISKSLSNLKCFQEAGTIKTNLTKFKQASSIESIKLVHKRLQIDIPTISNEIFKLYDEDKIKLISSPQNVIYYRVNKKLSEDDISKIKKEFDVIVNYKIKGLEQLIEVLNNNITIEKALQKHLNISKL